MPSIISPCRTLTQQEFQQEKLTLTRYNKLFQTENKLKQFYREVEREHKDDVTSKHLQLSQRSEAIRALRIRERQQLRELERSLNRKQRDKEELREKLKTIANRDVLLKHERSIIRQKEIENYKNECDIDRKTQQEKILRRHI